MRTKALRPTRPLAFHVPDRLGSAGSSVASLLARLAAIPDRHLRWKIILPYAVLALILGCAATYLATGTVTSSLRERFDNQLVESARVSADALARQERNHLETVRAITYTEGIPEAIASRDSARVGTLIEGTAANNEVQFLQVLDAAGQRVKAIYLADPEAVRYQEITDADTPATWAAVQEAIASAPFGGGKATSLVETANGPVVYTAGVVESANNVIGVVLTGTSLQTVVAQMKSQALADVTIYGADREPIGTTFVQPAESASQDADLGAPLAIDEAFGRTGVYREPKTVWGRDYHVLYAPLLLQGKEIGAYSVALPADFIMQAQSDARWKMALLFGLGMAAILAVGLYISRAITRRVHDLMRTAQQVSAGDFAARANITSRDEIGRLGAAVDQMTGTLQGQYLGTLRALASAVANKDPITLGHSVRVGQLAMMLGRHFELDDRTLAQLEISGYLHDVGKLGIRDSARLKLEALTPAQRQLLESHPHLDLLASGREESQAPAGNVLESGREPNSLHRSTRRNGESMIVRNIVEAADLYDAFRLGAPQLGGFTSEQTLTFLRTQAGAIIPIGMLDALAAVIPDWERQRASDPKLQRLLVETALEST
jgi:HAMP domain-containing protein